MSNTLHVARRYDVRYTPSGFFNWKQEEIADIIHKYFNTAVDPYNDYWEILDDDFHKGIEKIQNEKTILLPDMTNEEIIRAFEFLYDNRDEREEWVHLAWY